MGKAEVRGSFPGALLGALAFLAGFGVRPLDPRSFGWLMDGDYAAHTLGWLFFRVEPWAFPLGKLTRYPSGIGAHVLQSDSIPFMAVLGKLIAPFVAGEFQYVGPWLFSCFILQGVMAWRLVALFTTSTLLRVLGASLLATSPVLLFRAGHPSLCAHWVILLFLYWGFRLSRAQREGESFHLPWLPMLALCTWLTGIHPYLVLTALVLAAGLYGAAFLGFADRPGTGWFFRRFFATLAVVALGGWVFGYFEVSEPTAATWGYLPVDLVNFVNAGGTSSVLPRMRTAGGIMEGFCYPGLGGFLLLFLAWRIRRKAPVIFRARMVRWFYCPCFWATVLLAIFALSPHLKLGGNTILRLDWLYFPLGPIPGIFRATGRFVWPIYYLALVILIAVPLVTRSRRVAALWLFAAVALQWADLGRWFIERDARVTVQEWNRLKDPAWRELAGKFHAVALVPPYLPSEYFDWQKLDGFDYGTYASFGYFAATSGMRYNSALVARAPSRAVERYCTGFLEELEKEPLDPETLYIVRPRYHHLFDDEKVAACRTIDGYRVCHASAGTQFALAARSAVVIHWMAWTARPFLFFR